MAMKMTPNSEVDQKSLVEYQSWLDKSNWKHFPSRPLHRLDCEGTMLISLRKNNLQQKTRSTFERNWENQSTTSNQ